MTNDSPIAPAEQSHKVYVYSISLYFISVSVLYLWGYWPPFDINILEYLSLADIVKITAYPIASAFLFMAAGIILSGITGQSHAPGSGSQTPTGKFLNRHIKSATYIYLIATLFLLLILPVKYSTIIVPLLLGIPLSIYADNINLIERFIPAYRLRGLCTYMLAILPFFSFGQGYLKSQQILDGEKFDYMIPTPSNFHTPEVTDPTRSPRLVGHVGDHIFLWNPLHSAMTISKIKEGNPLTFRRFDANKAHSGP
ncbi:hypothetical protein [Pseudomonas monteilii]|uniref:hypothetical protein n=1 Tax=Pseudomonas monteilii TaxID=76759 RepID=UPI0034E2DD79